MQPLRRLILDNRAFTSALMALVLAMKLLVPGGFMPTFSNGQIVITLCSGTETMKTVMTMPGMEHGKPSDSQHGKVEQPCAFSGLSAPSMGAIDPVLLALAVVFIMSVALRPVVRGTAVARQFLRPPLRGPPASL